MNVYQYDYKTICRVLRDSTWTKAFDLKSKVPYAYNDDIWMSYDSFQSYQIKTDIIKQKNIKGAFTSFINSDDSNGVCGNEKYPVTKYLKKQFKQF
jgi:GH18 family chitinase